MELVVDIGNTFTKVAAFKNGKIQSVYSFQENAEEELGIDSYGFEPQRGIISSVSYEQEKWTSAFPQTEWIMLSHSTRVPFHSKYATPQTLGIDRIAIAAGAVTNYPNKNVLVIDAGTCVTFDFVSCDSNYLGGAISPGLDMRLKAMNAFTSKLPRVAIKQDVGLIGNSTDSCLQSGALHGLIAEIDGTIDAYRNSYKDLVIVLSGGDTKVLAPLVKNDIFARQNFLLEGLHAVLAYNTP